MNATELCDALAIQLKLEELRDTYMYGLGDRCADAKVVARSWSLTIIDVNGYPTTPIIHLVRGKPPVMIGMDVKHYSNTCNRTTQKSTTYRRSDDVGPYTLHKYIQRDGG